MLRRYFIEIVVIVVVLIGMVFFQRPDPDGPVLYEGLVWWVELIIWLVIALASYALTPRPDPPTPEAPNPYGIDEFHVPTATSGREIPVVMGTRWVDAPNVVWYGHLRVEEKREESCT